jgi:hypothetical protein
VSAISALFEKFSASSWFIIHKLTQDARETKHKNKIAGLKKFWDYLD